MFAVSADNSTCVNRTLHKNKRAPACGKADEEYLLTTKLFCGKCGALMFGESGTSATGRTYYYYKCANVKRRKVCNKKPLTMLETCTVSGFTIASIHFLLFCAAPGLARLQTAQISSLFFMQIIAGNPKLA